MKYRLTGVFSDLKAFEKNYIQSMAGMKKRLPRYHFRNYSGDWPFTMGLHKRSYASGVRLPPSGMDAMCFVISPHECFIVPAPKLANSSTSSDRQ